MTSTTFHNMNGSGMNGSSNSSVTARQHLRCGVVPGGREVSAPARGFSRRPLFGTAGLAPGRSPAEDAA